MIKEGVNEGKEGEKEGGVERDMGWKDRSRSKGGE